MTWPKYSIGKTPHLSTCPDKQEPECTWKGKGRAKRTWTIRKAIHAIMMKEMNQEQHGDRVPEYILDPKCITERFNQKLCTATSNLRSLPQSQFLLWTSVLILRRCKADGIGKQWPALRPLNPMSQAQWWEQNNAPHCTHFDATYQLVLLFGPHWRLEV